ncbi:MAG: hypothetical protein EOP20_06215 [Hyphomicrobiales bacterium]|nr:MAG: hypothetical protein EOP20_06215 [Hyphomicrobiales bacterium]
MYNAKLDLFKRFCEEFHRSFGAAPSFNDLMSEMGEIGRLRNLVVHADWNSTDEEGYTFVRLNRTKSGLFQEYIQFSFESLEAVIDRIISTDRLLSSYWEWRVNALQPRSATLQAE